MLLALKKPARAGFFKAEKEGFEPSIGLYSL